MCTEDGCAATGVFLTHYCANLNSVPEVYISEQHWKSVGSVGEDILPRNTATALLSQNE